MTLLGSVPSGSGFSGNCPAQESATSGRCHSGFNALLRQSLSNSRRAAERFHFHFSCLIFSDMKPVPNPFEPSCRLIPGNFAERSPTRDLSWEVTTPPRSAENERARAAIHKHGDPQRHPRPLHPPPRASVWLAGRCGRSCLRACWRHLAALFMHNNWDSWTECWATPPPSCYTTARFHYFSKPPLIQRSSKLFLISSFIYLFVCLLFIFCNS